jgi:HAD superfamily hydrolase (TIGR01509 family)
LAKLVIFDGDGVLYDTEPLMNSLQIEQLAAHGIKVTMDDIRAYIGMTGVAMYQDFERRFGVTLPDDFNAEFVRTYAERVRTESPLMPGATLLLDGLSAPACICTNSTRLRFDVTLAATGLDAYFKGHDFCLDDVTRGKPAPDLYLYACKQMKTASADALVVEDSLKGVEAGRAAGCRVVGFAGGSHCEPGHDRALKEAGAETVCHDMTTLASLLAREKLWL